MTTRRDFLKTMTMASAGLALGTGDLLGAPISVSQRKAAFYGKDSQPQRRFPDFERL